MEGGSDVVGGSYTMKLTREGSTPTAANVYCCCTAWAPLGVTVDPRRADDAADDPSPPIVPNRENVPEFRLVLALLRPVDGTEEEVVEKD